MKTTKIIAGYYKGFYKGIEFSIIKDTDRPNNEQVWYWKIENKDVEDVFPSKKIAIEAIIDWINNK